MRPEKVKQVSGGKEVPLAISKGVRLKGDKGGQRLCHPGDSMESCTGPDFPLSRLLSNESTTL